MKKKKIIGIRCSPIIREDEGGKHSSFYFSDIEKLLQDQLDEVAEKAKEKATDSADLFGEAILLEDVLDIIKEKK